MNKKKLNKIKGLAKDSLSLEMMISIYLDLSTNETSNEKATQIVELANAYMEHWHGRDCSPFVYHKIRYCEDCGTPTGGVHAGDCKKFTGSANPAAHPHMKDKEEGTTDESTG